MSRPPRVLVLCEYPSLHGGERSLLAMLDQPVFRTLDIHWAGPPGALAVAVRSRGRSYLPVSWHDPAGRRWPLDRCRLQLDQLISRLRPALIHANSLAMSRLSGPVVRARGIPGLGHLRDILRVNRRVRSDLGDHPRLLAVSQATRHWYVAAGLDPGRVRVLYNGVDVQTFRPRPPTGWLHRELGLPARSRAVAAIGQLGMRKGLDVYLAAAARVAPRLPEVHFLLAGARYSGKQEALDFEVRLRERARRGPLAGRCHFLGVRDDVPRLLNELTLLVHAARQEPLGRVLLEAAASGLAVIATDVGGTREIFPPQRHAARLLPPDDPNRLAAAMIDLLGDTAARQRMGWNARRRIVAAFQAEHAARHLWQHYQQLCPQLA